MSVTSWPELGSNAYYSNIITDIITGTGGGGGANIPSGAGGSGGLSSDNWLAQSQSPWLTHPYQSSTMIKSYSQESIVEMPAKFTEELWKKVKTLNELL